MIIKQVHNILYSALCKHQFARSNQKTYMSWAAPSAEVRVVSGVWWYVVGSTVVVVHVDMDVDMALDMDVDMAAGMAIDMGLRPSHVHGSGVL